MHLCSPSLSTQSTCHLRSVERRWQVGPTPHYVPFARMQSWTSPWLALWYGMVSHCPSGHFQKFLQQLKTTLFTVGSTSE